VPGQALFAAADEAKLTNNGTDTSTGVVADDKANGSAIGAPTHTRIATVVKGVSLAKAQANFNNTTLYPIRVKILV